MERAASCHVSEQGETAAGRMIQGETVIVALSGVKSPV
jgi:hypothetical protein